MFGFLKYMSCHEQIGGARHYLAELAGCLVDRPGSAIEGNPHCASP